MTELRQVPHCFFIHESRKTIGWIWNLTPRPVFGPLQFRYRKVFSELISSVIMDSRLMATNNIFQALTLEWNFRIPLSLTLVDR